MKRVAKLIFFLLLLVTASTWGRGSSAEKVDVPEVYRQCHAILWSSPMTMYSEQIAQGGPKNLRRILLEEALAGIRCSDKQLIAFMDSHRMPFIESREAPEFRDTPRGGYDRLLNFCIKSPTLLDRLVRGRCGGVVRIMMIGDRVSYVIAHGSK